MKFLILQTALSAVLILPIYLLLNHFYFHDLRRSALCYIFSVYLCGVYCAVGLPDVTYIRFELNLNLIPFHTMFSDLGQSLQNVLLFLPLGFFLPVLWRYFQKFRRTVLFGFCFSLAIELLQILTYRATDINDLMTNTAGATLGWCAGALLLKLFPSILPGKNTKQLICVYLVSFGAMFFFFPFVIGALVWLT